MNAHRATDSRPTNESRRERMIQLQLNVYFLQTFHTPPPCFFLVTGCGRSQPLDTEYPTSVSCYAISSGSRGNIHSDKCSIKIKLRESRHRAGEVCMIAAPLSATRSSASVARGAVTSPRQGFYKKCSATPGSCEQRERNQTYSVITSA